MMNGGMARASTDARVRPNLTENTRKFLLISSGINLYRLDKIFRKADDKKFLSKNGKMDLHTPTLTMMRHAGVDAFDLADILGNPNWDPVTGSAEDCALDPGPRVSCPTIHFTTSARQSHDAAEDWATHSED